MPQHGYVLVISAERLEELEADHSARGVCSQGIPKIPTALRRQKLICFISTRRGHLTHVGRATVYHASESGRDKLDIWMLEPLDPTARISALRSKMTGRHAWRAKRALGGGHLSAAAFEQFMTALEKANPAAFEAAAGLINRAQEVKEAEPTRAQVNWAYQRDATVTALEIARIPKERLKVSPQLSPVAAPVTSIFDSDEDMTTIEDLVILQDLENVGDDWEAVRRQRYPVKTFVNGDTKLSVLLANKLELERQLGTDLIYVNETMNSIVFVQYKMFAGEDGEEGYRPDKQFAKEITRMDALAADLAAAAIDHSCDGYRFAPDPFYLKFCSKLLTHEDKGHVPGIYVPLGFWKLLAQDPRAKGPRKGTVVYDDTFGRRRLTPTIFIDLVGRGWIGTTPPQSAALTAYLQAAVQGKRGVVLAVQSTLPPPEPEDEEEVLAGGGGPRRRKNRYPGRKSRKRNLFG